MANPDNTQPRNEQKNSNNTGSMACDGQDHDANPGTNNDNDRANGQQNDARAEHNFHSRAGEAVSATPMLNVYNGGTATVTINNYFYGQGDGAIPSMRLPNPEVVSRMSVDHDTDTASDYPMGDAVESAAPSEEAGGSTEEPPKPAEQAPKPTEQAPRLAEQVAEAAMKATKSADVAPKLTEQAPKQTVETSTPQQQLTIAKAPSNRRPLATATPTTGDRTHSHPAAPRTYAAAAAPSRRHRQRGGRSERKRQERRQSHHPQRPAQLSTPNRTTTSTTTGTNDITRSRTRTRSRSPNLFGHLFPSSPLSDEMSGDGDELHYRRDRDRQPAAPAATGGGSQSVSTAAGRNEAAGASGGGGSVSRQVQLGRELLQGREEKERREGRGRLSGREWAT